MVDVHGDTERPGEIVRSAERKDAKHSRCPNDGVGDRTDGPVAEPRSSVFGLGVDWAIDKKVTLSLGGVRRGLQRDDAPTSWDTRVMGGVRAAF